MNVFLDEGARLGPGGRYVLERKLGSGGAATVWLAEDTVLERPVAVKVLSEALAADESWLARFRREARLAASLQHPNLVSVYDFSAEEQPYLVMAHMPGGSLYDHIHAGERPEPERLVRDLLAALAAVHETGIIHRDIKPGNVLLAGDGTACLTDFGVARAEDATSLTQTGHIPGTARYMAPELWQGHAADERSDLYAMGILLRGAVGEDAPPHLHDLIDRLAAADPDDRPASAAEALAELESEERTPVTAPLSAEPEETPPREFVIQSAAQPSRRAALAGLAALAVVGIVAIALAVGGGDDSAPDASRTSGGSDAAQNQEGTNTEKPGEVAAAETAPEPVEGDPVALNAQGKELLDAGDPDAAIPILEQAVAAYSPSSRELEYGYALYNLGDALLQAGRPEEAIPILRRRLKIDDQIPVVQAKLDEAIAAARE